MTKKASFTSQYREFIQAKSAAQRMCEELRRTYEASQRTCDTALILHTETRQLLQRSAALSTTSIYADRCYLLTICAWCGVRIRVVTTRTPPQGNTSHGICPACLVLVEQQFEASENDVC